MRPFIRRMRADEGPRLRALRLHALAEASMAYSSTLAEDQSFPDDVWREWAVGGSAGCGSATFIAGRGRHWIALATGLARQDDPENAGPILVSMFVDSTARRVGVGYALGYEINQVIRKRIEEANGWIKTIGGMARTLHRGTDRVAWMFQLRATAYDLVRLRGLLAIP
jgi:hypothetical protein